MSGGHWNYENDDLRAYLFGYSSDTFNAKKHNIVDDVKLSALIFDVFDLLHNYDWYVSGDNGLETWAEDKKAFKDKWFKNNEKLDEDLIDNYLSEVKKDLMKSFGKD